MTYNSIWKCLNQFCDIFSLLHGFKYLKTWKIIFSIKKKLHELFNKFLQYWVRLVSGYFVELLYSLFRVFIISYIYSSLINTQLIPVDSRVFWFERLSRRLGGVIDDNTQNCNCSARLFLHGKPNSTTPGIVFGFTRVCFLLCANNTHTHMFIYIKKKYSRGLRRRGLIYIFKNINHF